MTLCHQISKCDTGRAQRGPRIVTWWRWRSCHDTRAGAGVETGTSGVSGLVGPATGCHHTTAELSEIVDTSVVSHYHHQTH